MSFGNLIKANPGLVYDTASAFNQKFGEVYFGEVIEQQYTALEYPNVVPAGRMINGGIGLNMQYVSQLGVNSQGNASITNMYNNMPIPNVTLDYFKQKVRNFKVEIGFILGGAKDDLLSGTLREKNINFDSLMNSYINACIFQQERAIDQIQMLGDPVLGIQGLYDNDAIDTVIATNNDAGNSTKWEDKSANKILQDFINVTANMQIRSGTTRTPTLVVLPIKAYNALGNIISAAGSRSIKDYIETTYSQIGNKPVNFSFYSSPLLTTYGLFIDNRFDDDMTFFRPALALPYEPYKLPKGEVQYGYQTQVCEVSIKRPYSALYLSGIA